MAAKPEETVIPFGKHVGQRLCNVPLTYLDWLIGQPWLREPLKSAVTEYMGRPEIQRKLEQERQEDKVLRWEKD